jgi:F0F1-type ATP synthase membrane subunit b/b'
MANAKDRLSDAKPYVQRALQDEEVRENVKNAIAAAREIYDELIGARKPSAVAARVATDKEIQDNLRSALDDLKNAANRVQGKSEHSARNATLLLAGIVLGILFNPVTGPQTRRWLADRILGESDAEAELPSGNGSPVT